MRRVGADIVVLRRKERRVVGKEIRTDELLIKQEDVRKYGWQWKNILKECLNAGTLDPDSCLRHFCMFTKEDKGVVL